MLLFVLATEHTLLHRVLSIWCQILFPDLHDAALYNYCKTECRTCNFDYSKSQVIVSGSFKKISGQDLCMNSLNSFFL